MSSKIIDFHRRRREIRGDAGFTNLITGAGTKRAHVEQFDWRPPKRLQKWQLNSLYEAHELVWKLVDYLPDDGTRNWIRFPSLEKAKQDQIKRITAEMQFRQALNEGLRMARLHGGAAIYLPIDDGQDDAEPLDLKNIKGYEPAEVFEIDHIWPNELKRSLRHTHYCMSSEAGGEHLIHRSRLIILQGCRVGRDTLIENRGWSQSVIARTLAPLLAWSIAQGTVPQILKDFIVDVIRMNGLNSLAISQDDADLKDFLDRMDAMSLAMSLLNKLVLDSTDELERKTATVSGLDGLIATADRRLVAASGMPYQKLLGQAQGNAVGGSAGDSQDREWNKAVSAYQHDTILPALEQWLLIVGALVGEAYLEPQFCPLDEPSAKEQAEVLDKTASAAAKLAEWSIVSNPELAGMFEDGKVTPIPKLDAEKREQLEPQLGDLTEAQLLQLLEQKQQAREQLELQAAQLKQAAQQPEPDPAAELEPDPDPDEEDADDEP